MASIQIVAPIDPGEVVLTRRDREILYFLLLACENKEMLAELEITPKTLRHRIQSLCLRAGVVGVPQLKRWANEGMSAILACAPMHPGLHGLDCPCGETFCRGLAALGVRAMIVRRQGPLALVQRRPRNVELGFEGLREAGPIA